MPKVTNSRKFLKAVRQSASPLGDAGTGSAITLADHQQFADMKSGDLLEVIKGRLNHPLPSERCIGTDMISTFLNAKRLAQFKPAQFNEIIRLLTGLLIDRAENVRFGAIDALCYLSSLSDEMCDQLVRNNILQSIMAMLEQYFLPIESWAQPKVTDKKLTLNLYVDCFNLLTNLCGVSSQFLEALLSHAKIVDVLRKGFQTLLEPCEKVSFIPIAIATAQCLGVICEDERAYGKLIQPTNSSSPNLSDVMTHIINMNPSLDASSTCSNPNNAEHYLKTLVISIAACHYFKQVEKSTSSVKEELLLKLSQIVDLAFGVDGTNYINTLITELTGRIKEDLSSELKSLNEMLPAYDQIKFRYLTKRACFELLTNLLSSEDEDEEGDEEEMNSDDEGEEMMESTCNDGASSTLTCDPLVAQFCQQKSLLNILVAELSANVVAPEVEQLFVGHVYGKDILSTIQTAKVSALTLVSNLAASKLITQSDPALASIWQTVNSLVFVKTSSTTTDSILAQQEMEIQEEAINVVREFISTFKDITLSMEDLDSLCQFAQRYSGSISSYTKVNIVRVMASVASATVARHCETPTEGIAQFVEQITTLLINGFHSDSDLVLRAEILDSLIDIYSDDNALTLQLFKRMNLLATLKEIAGVYRREMKSNTRIVRQNAVVSTVGLNLNRFIKYKQKVVR